jgi:hypothetical protein
MTTVGCEARATTRRGGWVWASAEVARAAAIIAQAVIAASNFKFIEPSQMLAAP